MAVCPDCCQNPHYAQNPLFNTNIALLFGGLALGLFRLQRMGCPSLQYPPPPMKYLHSISAHSSLAPKMVQESILSGILSSPLARRIPGKPMICWMK
jgi:hypothetical protein